MVEVPEGIITALLTREPTCFDGYDSRCVFCEVVAYPAGDAREIVEHKLDCPWWRLEQYAEGRLRE